MARLIDADALNNKFAESSRYDGDEVLEIINKAPTVERPKGEWIEHYDCTDGFTWLTCSRCMFKAYEEDYHYCPNCGADMRKEEEDDNP